MIEFIFDERKATQAAARLLASEGGQMPYLKLIKLLYMADREVLIETGAPMTGDRFFAMKLGPVLSRVYDLIKDSEPEADSFWHHHIATRDMDSVLVHAAETRRLSEYEEQVLDRLSACFAEKTQWSTADYTHDFPEWSNPGATSIPIAPEAILTHAGYSEAEIQIARHDAAAEKAFHEQMARIA